MRRLRRVGVVGAAVVMATLQFILPAASRPTFAATRAAQPASASNTDCSYGSIPNCVSLPGSTKVLGEGALSHLTNGPVDSSSGQLKLNFTGPGSPLRSLKANDYVIVPPAPEVPDGLVAVVNSVKETAKKVRKEVISLTRAGFPQALGNGGVQLDQQIPLNCNDQINVTDDSTTLPDGLKATVSGSFCVPQVQVDLNLYDGFQQGTIMLTASEHAELSATVDKNFSGNVDFPTLDLGPPVNLPIPGLPGTFIRAQFRFEGGVDLSATLGGTVKITEDGSASACISRDDSGWHPGFGHSCVVPFHDVKQKVDRPIYGTDPNATLTGPDVSGSVGVEAKFHAGPHLVLLAEGFAGPDVGIEGFGDLKYDSSQTQWTFDAGLEVPVKGCVDYVISEACTDDIELGTPYAPIHKTGQITGGYCPAPTRSLTDEQSCPGTVPAPTNLRAQALDPTHIALSWQSPGSTVYMGFNISQNGGYLGSVTGLTTTYTVSGLSPATQYCYTVTTVDSNNRTSSPSNQACVTTPSPPRIVPGGVWIYPNDGSTSGGVITFSAHAYPSNPGDPPIDHVNFTIWWPAVGPRSGPWKVACTATPPSSGDMYSCGVNLQSIGAPYGTLDISFDVYDQQGNYNLAPNGTRAVIYGQQAPQRCGVSAAFSTGLSGQTSNCYGVWTDRSSYNLGDTIQYCYVVPYSVHVRLIDHTPDGNSQVVLDGNDDGTGQCSTATITPPTGQECLELDLLVNNQTYSTQTCWQVLGNTQPAPEQCATATVAANAGGQTANCYAVWTDRSSYNVGDTIQYCYVVPYPVHVRLIDHTPDGNSQVVLDGNDDGTGQCSTATITPPTGQECLELDLFVNNQVYSTQTCWQVYQTTVVESAGPHNRASRSFPPAAITPRVERLFSQPQ